MNGNYRIKIQIIDRDEVIRTDEVESLEIAEECLGKCERWIKEHDEIYYKKCIRCNTYKHIDELSVSEDDEDEPICQDCIVDVIGEAKEINT